jgi:hypothetical protein
MMGRRRREFVAHFIAGVVVGALMVAIPLLLYSLYLDRPPR